MASIAILSVHEVHGQALTEKTHWVGSWGTAQQIPEAQNSLPQDDLRDATLRQVVHLSIGGSQLCLHLSNAFGTAPLHLQAVHIAAAVNASSAAIAPGSDRAVTFAGQLAVTIPAGAEFLSDPVNFRAAPFSNVTISIYYEDPPAQQTEHPGSRSTSYFVHGNQVSAPDLPNAKTVEHWYQISEVDVAAAPAATAVVALGDSITDGHGSTVNGNDRWPDILAQRLQANPKTRDIGVMNAGIGGGRVLLDGLGPNALARFDRDVLARPGTRCVILLEGVNDLGVLARDGEKTVAEHAALVAGLISGYEQMIVRAHARGIRIVGGTITPFAGSGYYHPGALGEHDRQALNDWIRMPGHFDGFVDFDATIRDPAQPDHILPAFDSGDHLHPSLAGYRAMGTAVPVGSIEPSPQPLR